MALNVLTLMSTVCRTYSKTESRSDLICIFPFVHVDTTASVAVLLLGMSDVLYVFKWAIISTQFPRDVDRFFQK